MSRVVNRRIAILGAGKIGESLIAGLLLSGWRMPEEIVATARGEGHLTALAETHGIEATASNRDAVQGSGTVVIAVKPQDIEALLGEIAPVIQPEQTVLSVAAAIPTAAIENHLGAPVPVVRSMPNAPAVVHEGPRSDRPRGRGRADGAWLGDGDQCRPGR